MLYQGIYLTILTNESHQINQNDAIHLNRITLYVLYFFFSAKHSNHYNTTDTNTRYYN